MSGIDGKDRDFKRLCLTKIDALCIFILYGVLIITSIFAAVLLLSTYPASTEKELSAIISGLSMSLSGSSVFYCRKLYQACINNTYTFSESRSSLQGNDEIFRRVGTIAFFLLRPIFGLAFFMIVYALWRLSISASDENSLAPSSGFLYITMTLGFLSGFLAGRVLTFIEGYGANRLGPLFGKDG